MGWSDDMIALICELSAVTADGVRMASTVEVQREIRKRKGVAGPGKEEWRKAAEICGKRHVKLRSKNAGEEKRIVVREDIKVEVGTVAWWEARIKAMDYVQLDALCMRNSMSFKRDGGNRGILSMRARNVLYAALRRGIKLKGLQ